MWSQCNRIVSVDTASGGGLPMQSLHDPLDFNVETAESNLGRVY
jgi:hypothetical protein